MRKRNSPRRRLERRILGLKKRRDEKFDLLFNTTDDTRAKISSFQNYLYLGQIALGAFKNLTNYHVKPGKRFRNVAVTIGSLILMEYLRRRFSKQKNTPDAAQ